MRSIIFLFGLLCVTTGSARTGQVSARIQQLKDKGTRFVPVPVFHRVDEQQRTQARWSVDLKEATVLGLDPAGLRAMRALENVALEIPSHTGPLWLDLVRTGIAPEGAVVRMASGAVASLDGGIHYRGMVRGMPGSWAAISVYENEVMGLINDGSGQLVLGRFEDKRDQLHVLYRDEDLHRRPAFTCGTVDDQQVYHTDQLVLDGGERTVRCVRYYWEVNHNVFLDKGSSTTNYVTGLFNQSAVLFDNDGIDVTLSELFIWDVPSPYTGPGSGDFLDQFGVTRTTFNGDLAHLIGYGGGGGVAWLNTLCSTQSRLRMAYSGINSTYSNVPAYSWSTMVVTHEAGHNLGSRHTHACSWNGNGTNIDGCGPTANIDYREGTCAIGPVPAAGVGGTIMSYCHLISGVGINFANGFGPQPTAVIVNAVNAASCLGICGTTCDAPSNLNVTNLLLTTATLTWSNVGATSYDLQWRAVGASTWNTVPGLTTTTYALTSLTQGTAYEFQVRSNCGASTSNYSTLRTFTTLVPCPESLEPNGTLATAPLLTLPASVSALIATNGDQDYYRFTIATNSTINISLSGLPFDYDLRLLDNAGAELANSAAGGTTSEFITFPGAGAGTYYVHVFGYNGAFDVNRCYALNVSSFAVAVCSRPVEVVVSDVVYNGAQVDWAVVQSASAYDLRWRVVGDPTWTEATGLTTNSYTFTDLAYSTEYEVQVRAVCGTGGAQGGSTSEYSTVVTFTTLDVPCEVEPGLRVNLQVLLDGLFDPSLGLMHDSLRTQGLIPLQEPYTAMGYPVSGLSTTTNAILEIEGANAAVDWVLLELRTATAPFEVLETRAVLVKRDGRLMEPDGYESIRFCTEGGSYRISVRHRNHLGCMSGLALGLGPLPATFVFTNATTYGTQALRDVNGISLMWAGNAVLDDVILYSGASNDRDAILLAIGGVVPTNTVAGYRLEDVNLDGVVRYAGANNDRDLILSTIGGVIPTVSVVEQMP